MVSISKKGKKVTIGEELRSRDGTDYNDFVTYQPKQIFIGISEKNKMTEHGRGYGEAFDGNSILLHIRKRDYIFIGSTVFLFRPQYPIVLFFSPVWNDDIPYPYAIDSQGYVYLFNSGVVLEPTDGFQEWMKNGNDPTSYYIDHQLITADRIFTPPKQPVQIFQNIKEFYIGTVPYTLEYDIDPGESFKLYVKRKSDNVEQYGVSVVYYDGTKKVLNKNEFAELIKEFGRKMGFQKLYKIMIYNRQDT